MTSQLIREARMFAIVKHANQKRKYTGQPYIIHPEAVADLVESVGGTDEMIAAAWLHDVVEDTATTLQDIEFNFGYVVKQYVYYLTDVGGEGNRAARKAAYALKLQDAPKGAKMIKLADLIDNTASIVEHDPKFARVYLAEKEALLYGALKDGDRKLWKMAHTQVAQGLKDILLNGIK